MAARFVAEILHDDNDELIVPIRQNRIFRDRTNPFDYLDDFSFYERYRFNRDTVLEIAGLVAEDLERPTKRSSAIPVAMQVLMSLRYLASNSFQQVVGDTLNCHKATVCRVLNRFCISLCRRINEYIKYPTQNKVEQFRQKFFEMAGFPQVVGCVDGTLIKIIAPNSYENSFVCRKGYHAINVQGICGPHGQFTNIIAKWPGSAADARIFNESDICSKLQAGECAGILLGDKGYGCKTFLLTPYKDPVTESRKRYNVALKRTRVLIEQVYGRWKRRFYCLHAEIRLKPDRASRLITACAILHNIAVEKGLPDFDDDVCINATSDEAAINSHLQDRPSGLNFRNRFADRNFV